MTPGDRLARLFAPDAQATATESPRAPAIRPRLARRASPDAAINAAFTSPVDTDTLRIGAREPFASPPPVTREMPATEPSIQRVVEHVRVAREIAVPQVDARSTEPRREDQREQSATPTAGRSGTPVHDVTRASRREPDAVHAPLAPAAPKQHADRTAPSSSPRRADRPPVEQKPLAQATPPRTEHETPKNGSRVRAVAPPNSAPPVAPLRVEHQAPPTPAPTRDRVLVAEQRDQPARASARELPASTALQPPAVTPTPLQRVPDPRQAQGDDGAQPSRTREVAVPSAPPAPATAPAAARRAEARHDVSIRIGRVEIVAATPKTAAARPAHRPARAKRAPRRHQIEPRLPIPPGRW